MPVIPTPPAGAVKLAFFTAIRYRSINGAITAYNSAVTSLAETETAHAELKLARLEHERVIRLLEDQDTIHAIDQAERDRDLIRAEEELAEAKYQAEMRRRQRQQSGGGQLNEAETEFVESLQAKAAPARYRELAEEIVRQYTAGRDKLSPADEAYIKSIREACEQAIEDLG